MIKFSQSILAFKINFILTIYLSNSPRTRSNVANRQIISNKLLTEIDRERRDELNIENLSINIIIIKNQHNILR